VNVRGQFPDAASSRVATAKGQWRTPEIKSYSMKLLLVMAPKFDPELVAETECGGLSMQAIGIASPGHSAPTRRQIRLSLALPAKC